MLTGNFWITDFGDWNMQSSQHAAFAAAVMLKMDLATQRVPVYWTVKGIPEEEFDKALKRGADVAAISFLALSKNNDPRLWALREYGWIRTTKNSWNLWRFDDKTAKLARNAHDYWDQQTSMNAHEMIDIHEFETEDQYAISVEKLLAGGNPKILKNLAMGRVDAEGAEEKLAPVYSTAKYSELERRSLYGKTGDNPRRRR